MVFKPRDVTSAAVFAVLTAIGAWISIPLPFTPVPLTLQVFFVLLAGAVLGSKRGMLAEAIYLLLGLVGLPILAGGESGPSVLIGPTGGYLLGFLFAPYLIGRIAEKNPSPNLKHMTIATLIGLVPIYTLGIGCLWIWLNTNLSTLLIVGVFPFLPGDIMKAALAAFVATRNQLRQLTTQRTNHSPNGPFICEKISVA